MRAAGSTAVLVLMVLAACGDNQKQEQATAGAESDSARAAAAIDAGRKVQVDFSEWRITSSHDSIPSGQVTFAIQNKGSVPHVVEITGKHDDWKSMSIAPGDAITMAMVLDTGEYMIICPDSAGAHSKRGMQHKIKVTAQQ